MKTKKYCYPVAFFKYNIFNTALGNLDTNLKVHHMEHHLIPWQYGRMAKVSGIRWCSYHFLPLMTKVFLNTGVEKEKYWMLSTLISGELMPYVWSL